ncbi:MAG: LamG-like jellyroll fold domain-containing protein, partial [Thermoplasmata archaeon]
MDGTARKSRVIGLLIVALLVGCMLLPTAGVVMAQSADSDYIARWLFNEGSGTTFTDSGANQFVGTVHGATWPAGVEGTGLGFDGASSYATVEDDPTLRPANLCIEVWLMPQELETSSPVIKRVGTDGVANWQIEFINDGRDVRFSYYQGVWRTYDTDGGPITHPGYWYHIVTGIVNGVPRTYVNGVEEHAVLYFNGVAQADGTAAPALNTDYIGEVMLGNGHYGFYNGRIDELTLYDWQLDSDVVQQRFAARQTTLPPQIDNPDDDTDEDDETFYGIFNKADVKAMLCSLNFWLMMVFLFVFFTTLGAFATHREKFEKAFKEFSAKAIEAEVSATDDKNKVGNHVDPKTIIGKWLDLITSDAKIKKWIPAGYINYFNLTGSTQSYAVLAKADAETENYSTAIKTVGSGESYSLSSEPSPVRPTSYANDTQEFSVEQKVGTCDNCRGIGKFTCSKCNGQGKWTCSTCHGD